MEVLTTIFSMVEILISEQSSVSGVQKRKQTVTAGAVCGHLQGPVSCKPVLLKHLRKAETQHAFRLMQTAIVSVV